MQAFHFRLTMYENVDTMMWETFDVNLVIQMWLKVQFFPLLVLKLSKYKGVVEIAMV